MSVAAIAPPLLFAAFLWWFLTGAILWLDRRPPRTFGWSFACAGILAALALAVLVAVSGKADAAGAYWGFAAALVIWGWHEMAFLMGFITGPRREALPPGASGWKRFRLAAATVLHHEIALALTALLLVALSWGAPNQIGAMTFLVLWAMRLSAKFNLFLGAPYRAEELLPAHLAHLASYFRDRKMNPLFPLSVAAGAGFVFAAGVVAFAAEAAAHERTGSLLLLAIAALGVIEHVFLFVRPPNAFLWGWAARDKAGPPAR